LQAGEILVTVDVSENYSFILQDAAQEFHWNNSQATIHPFCCLLCQFRRATSSELCDYFRLSTPQHNSHLPFFKNALWNIPEKFSQQRIAT